MPTPLRYRVSMPQPNSHLFVVRAEFPSDKDALTVALPVWTPGSYLVREYARHVQDVRATRTDGKPLTLTRIDKRSILIEGAGPSGCGTVIVDYRVYANELSVRTSHLDASHGYFNGATLFYYVEALRNQRHIVDIDAPAGWKVFTALERDGTSYVAANYDQLVDSPFEIGPHEPIAFTAANVPHEVVTWGDVQVEPKKFSDDLTKIIEAEARVFGGLPQKRYLFLVYGSDKVRGGLEHADSTALIFPRANFGTARGWEDFLSLVAHEYFHLWNVKRIKPRRFVPFDYGKENYSALLWFFEGATSYYDMIFVRRAGLMSAARYLTRLGETISSLESTPGRLAQTLEESSLLSWIKHYRPDENSPNSAISYYVKGEVVSMLLDLTIREATGGSATLDDLMRALWKEYGDGRGVPEHAVEELASKIAGRSLKSFFDRALRSTEELDYSALSWVGLTLKHRVKEAPSDRGGTPPRAKVEKPGGWLGIHSRGGGAIASVLEGSPAMEGGLCADDEIVALDGQKCDANALVSRCEDRHPGDEVRVTYFRRDRLAHATVRLGTRPLEMAWLARVDEATVTAAQKAAFTAWLDAPWEHEANGNGHERTEAARAS